MTRQCAVLVAMALLGVGAAGAEDASFGELPPGWISTSETSGVDAEICRDHLFDPVATTGRLPAGLRLIPAAEAARNDPSLQALLAAHPERHGHAVGSLCFMSVHRLTVDGESIGPAGPVSVAFWWARAEGPRHPDMRGRATWVQLGSWYPARLQQRSAILRADPMAEFVDVEAEQVGAHRWQLRLALPTETVTANVTGSGQRVASRAVQPGYMSVPMSGLAAGYFSVFTYVGHHHQSAEGAWQAVGTGVFSDAFQVRDDARAFATVFQDGWRSRAGLYRMRER